MYDFAATEGPPDGSHGLALDRNGALYTLAGGSWNPFDFNALYAGYFPACEFTALAFVEGAYYLAGFDTVRPRLFSSLLGNVWEERNLVMRDPLAGEVEARGRIRRILFDSGSRQLFLISAMGDVITLTDCPKCVLVRHIFDGEFLDAALENNAIVFTLDQGRRFEVPLENALFNRVSFSFALERLKKGQGIVADLRSPEENQGGSLPRSFNVAIVELSSWLEGQNREEPLFFVCHTGLQADRAALFARRQGFYQAYSLGGIKNWAHIE